MAKAPREGHVKTRLAAAGSPAFVLDLYRAFIEDSIELGVRAGAGVVIVCPSADTDEITAWVPSTIRVMAQRGNGLADALASTFEILCVGSDRVVAFNGDSPHLSPAVLDAAFAAIRDTDVVVGPCDDGGYFLVGMRKAHPELFAPSALGTGAALESLLAQASRLGLSWYLTASHYDVDVPADVARLAEELRVAPELAPRTAKALSGWAPFRA